MWGEGKGENECSVHLELLECCPFSILTHCRCRLRALDFDEATANSLEAEMQRETAAVRQCKERVDELSSGLAGT